jgi:FkbM family methyltransferase
MDSDLQKIESIKISRFRRVLNRLLQKLNISVMKYGTYHLLIENSKNFRRLQQMNTSEISLNLFDFLVKNCGNSKSQLFQDLIVTYIIDNYLTEIEHGAPRIFIEFGACDGLKFSNTFLLEKNGWQGILAEPARKWHKELIANRKCTISFNAVSNVTGKKVPFIETIEGEFSSLVSNSESDIFSNYRKDNISSTYLVDTISLNDLIEENGISGVLTYLSIDTEGGERNILETFDLNKYRPAIISVEHNFSGEERLLDDFLLNFGYVRVLSSLSRFENWYCHNTRIAIPADGKF